MNNKGAVAADIYFRACLHLHKSDKESDLETDFNCDFYEIHGNAIYDQIYKEPEKQPLKHRNNFIDKWEELKNSYKENLDH